MLAPAHARAPILAHHRFPKTSNRSTGTARRATTRGRRVVSSASDADSAGGTTAGSVASSGSAGDPLASFRDGDLLVLRVAGPEETDAGILASRPLLDREWFFEVVGDASSDEGSTDGSADGSPTATAAEGRQRTSLFGLCRGVAAFLTHDLDGESMTLVPVRGSDESRFSPNLAAREWTRERFPAWHALLADLESTGEYPRDSNSVLRPFLADEPLSRIVGVEKITDYKTLRNDVLADPSYWRDGAGPNFVETDPARQATNNAGELLALLLGARGVVMTQLWAGWEDDDAQQPVDAPFALRALRECASDSKIIAVPAPVPGLTARKGLTAILCADVSPYRERATHLASFGAQAALVAGSPYYQYLVGRVLGYKETNIDAHVRSSGGRLTAPVVREAEKDLFALSEALPRTPWRETEITLQEETEKAKAGFFFLDFGTDGAPRAVSSAYSGRGERKNRRRGKKKSSTVRSVEDAESMFGGRGKKKR
jgi:hypothetical protein